MRVSTAISAAAFAAILGSGVYFARRDGAGSAPENGAIRESEGPLRDGWWYLSRDDLDRAAEEFAKALADPREMIEARQGIRRVVEKKKASAGRDVARLLELTAWLDAHGLRADAELLAARVLEVDPRNRGAHLRLEHFEYEGVWYEKDEADLVEAAVKRDQEVLRLSRMTPREKRVHLLVDDFGRRFGRPIEVRDCAPESPWFLMMEETDGRLAALVLAEFDRVLDDLFAEFSRRFGEVFAVSRILEDRPLPVFVFHTRERYLQNTGGSYQFTSHMDRRSGVAYLAGGDGEMYEVVIHAATWLLVEEALHRDRGLKISDSDSCWLNAGLACLFEAWRHDTEGRIRFEGLAPHRLPHVRRAMTAAKSRSLTDLLKLSGGDLLQVQRGRTAAQELEAQCWSLVFFLWEAGGGKYRENFRRFCAAIVEGRAPVEAAERSFGDLRELDREWKEFILGIK
ncbi:MAG: hypothetical protein HYY18_23565 [Planctomycetes bacterium]|nr:hypothetical protein [Planctomycetota bacterium]